MLEQESKDDKSEKAFRSAVHAKFPYIKADDLPKGKYALRDTAERLVARFPTEEAKEDYKAKVKERQFDHRVAWKCSECDHLGWEHLRGQVGNPNLKWKWTPPWSKTIQLFAPPWMSKRVRAPFRPPPDETRTPPTSSALGDEEQVPCSSTYAGSQRELEVLRKQVKNQAAIMENMSTSSQREVEVLKKQVEKQAASIEAMSTSYKRKLREHKDETEADFKDMRNHLHKQGAKLKGTTSYSNCAWDKGVNVLFKESDADMEARTDIRLGNKDKPRNYSPAFVASCPRSVVEDAIHKCGYSVGTVPDGEWPKIVQLMEAPVDEGCNSI